MLTSLSHTTEARSPSVKPCLSHHLPLDAFRDGGGAGTLALPDAVGAGVVVTFWAPTGRNTSSAGENGVWRVRARVARGVSQH